MSEMVQLAEDPVQYKMNLQRIGVLIELNLN